MNMLRLAAAVDSLLSKIASPLPKNGGKKSSSLAAKRKELYGLEKRWIKNNGQTIADSVVRSMENSLGIHGTSVTVEHDANSVTLNFEIPVERKGYRNTKFYFEIGNNFDKNTEQYNFYIDVNGEDEVHTRNFPDLKSLENFLMNSSTNRLVIPTLIVDGMNDYIDLSLHR